MVVGAINDVMLQYLYSVRSCGAACFDCLSMKRGRGGTGGTMREHCEGRSALRGHLQVRRGYGHRAHNALGVLNETQGAFTVTP